MKKILLVLLFSLITSTTFATTSEYIEFSSGEIDDGSIYLDSYEDYENILQGTDEQELYKKEHLKMLQEAINIYDSTKSENVVKALVLSTEDAEDYYSYDSYGTYKIKYQPLNVQILEGKYKNQTFDTTYILTVDSYENIKVKEVKENQKINVIVYEESGDVSVYATTIDASIDRIGYSITLLVITVILLGIYLGTKSFKIIPQLILIADIILLIFVPEMMDGRSILWMTLVTILLYVITNICIKVGLNAKTMPAIITTFSVLLISTIGLLIFNSIASMSGIIYGITTIIESFPKGTINFSTLNLAIYMIMSTIVVSDIACKVMNVYEDLKIDDSRRELKEYLSDKILTVCSILFITIIPQYLYLLVAKYSYNELINSEMLTSEIVRILFLIIAMLLTSEVGIWIKKIFVEQKDISLEK